MTDRTKTNSIDGSRTETGSERKSGNDREINGSGKVDSTQSDSGRSDTVQTDTGRTLPLTLENPERDETTSSPWAVIFYG
ncbi:hypothetical protein [Halostagnicola sp. A-GB9-2]|uniref:hypothetical protein n=1 Tax=Halostagnicola sp. A-GB9-2 TaxID=3048066 RepID=UPI0024BF6DF6|nr:hypothetical protein [Halostagnicola sp. A-GB9-2]MDJ1433155.1 hypothetical protein [Halostagnicola sp. A-GB9-2]